MKPQREFTAERAAAQHCEALLRQAPTADPLPAFARFGDRLGEALPTALAPWHGSIPPAITYGAVYECAAHELESTVGALAANSLLAVGAADHPVLLSIGAPAVFSLIDRAFGGRGAVPDPLPAAFPASCEILVQRIERVLAERIAAALDGHDLRTLRRDGSLTRLSPFAPETWVAVLDFAVTGDRALENWCFTLAAPPAALGALFGDGGATPRSMVPTAANPAAEPFADVPLELRAVLVELDVAVSILAALEVGSVLPVAVARRVPLRIGTTTIAHGTVGELDDRAALQISQIA